MSQTNEITALASIFSDEGDKVTVIQLPFDYEKVFFRIFIPGTRPEPNWIRPSDEETDYEWETLQVYSNSDGDHIFLYKGEGRPQSLKSRTHMIQIGCSRRIPTVKEV